MMKRRAVHLILLFLLTLPILLIPQQPALAATVTVANATQLIAEISIANGTAGTIILANNITLTNIIDTGLGNTGLPVVTGNITIEGQGHTITRGVGAPFRIFRVQAGGNLKLNNLIVSNGNGTDGGGAYNAGTLTINHSAFSGNSASGDGSGVYNNAGTLTITNSTFSANSASSNRGGGVFNDTTGTLTITNSTFSGNSAGNTGGGVNNHEGTLTITNSTFSANSASGAGGVENNDGTTTIANSTFSANSATTGGGVVNVDGTTTITNSTFSANSATTGGGVFKVGIGSLTITNSIIANSSPGGNCGGGSISGSFSLADDDTCGGFTQSLGINLAPLADNGGSTLTHALVPSSSALDTANATPCTTSPVNGRDQRGINRGVDGDATGTPNFPEPGDCDIGAFELGGFIYTLQFASSSSAITPGGVSTLPIPLTLDGFVVSGYAPITAYVWVSGGTAVAGTDYAPFGVQTVTFNPNDQIKPVTINLLNSGLTADRTIVLSFATTHGTGFSGAARLGTRTSHTITLKASAPGAAPVRNYYATRIIPLRWARVSWATGYEIQVDNEPSFAAPRIDENLNLPAGIPAFDAHVPGDGTYYWRVLAKKPDGTPGTYSPTQSFVVAGT